MSEQSILRAAQAFYQSHNAMLAGMASAETALRAEEALHAAIWEHFDGGQMPQHHRTGERGA